MTLADSTLEVLFRYSPLVKSAGHLKLGKKTMMENPPPSERPSLCFCEETMIGIFTRHPVVSLRLVISAVGLII